MSASFLDSEATSLPLNVSNEPGSSTGLPSSELSSTTTTTTTSSTLPASVVLSPAPIEHPPAITRGERQLPVFCPQCGTRIEIRKGLCGNRLIDAILLQAERLGTELECQRCQTRFVFQKLAEIPEAKRERNKQQAFASKF
ncbi:hypothetical protein [Thalassoglobus polymorphus]|uniref:hypothetical protein n=1 Tax=Thalassoglobus polymorphus TaxID=2527994 RepID=UPI0011A9D41B|nr:hypothetical protein [Thalassoglobus polymorphus]